MILEILKLEMDIHYDRLKKYLVIIYVYYIQTLVA